MEQEKVFENGFKYKNFKFGWSEGKLFRLPIKIAGRTYNLREVPTINITKNIQGYRIIRDRKSLRQLLSMTKKINYKLKILNCKECPELK